MTPKTDTPKQLDVKNLNDQQRAWLESLTNKYNELKAKGAI